MKANICKGDVPALVREREHSSSLFNISTILNSALDFEKIMHAVLSEASQALCTEAAWIALRRGDRWIIRYEYGLTDGILGISFSDREFPSAALAMNKRKPLAVRNDFPGETGVAGVKGDAAGPGLVVPLITQGTVTGCLFFRQPVAVKPFDDTAIDFAERAGALISVGLENARVAKQYELLSEQTEEERAMFGALLEDIPAGVLIVENSGKLIRGNEQVERIFRQPVVLKPEAGQLIYKGFHADGTPYSPLDWPLARSIAKGELVTAEEIRIVRGDGTEGMISVSSGPIRDVRGRIIAGVMIVNDITERKEAEKKRSHLAAVVESSEQAVISLTKDENGIITTWSKGAERLYGYRAAEVIGRHVSLLAPPGFPDDIAGILQKIRKGESVDRHETVRMRKDGSLVHVSLTVSPIRDVEGRTIGASTIAIDISDRRRIEEALRESELKFRKIASSARDAIILVDNEGLVEFWNDAASRMFGFRVEEILGKNLHSLIMPPRYTADFERGFQAFRSTGEGRFIGTTYEITAKRKDGSEFPVELSLAAMKLNDRWNAIGIVRDITDRKRAEEELKRTLEELERSNRELQQFAYVASHDLQEPLRTVAGFVELLRMKYRGKTLDEKADSYISFAVEGVHRMSALINDLLDYSRVGTMGGKFEPVDMGRLLGQATGNLKTAIKESQAEITSGPLPVMMGDQTQLVQLLQNLIANAIKFRKKDVQPRIRISAERREDQWVFGVHDNGIGIEPDYYEKIFVIFQRLHTRAEYPGTGIGLAISKRIVERHGGRIWVESKPGEGSSFYFSIPDKQE